MSKIKVAIYCRVSTEDVTQDQSYQSQLQYFTEKFKDQYEIINVYADRGSGLSLKNRKQFRQMLTDAGLELEERKGKINTYLSNRIPKFKYILTKSVSRFSRNTEITGIIRDLKNKGVYIIFDDINKSTEDEESEMLLGFLQNIAQEESRNKSQIIKWGKKRSAENGKVSLNADVYGYVANLEENTLRIIPQEAEIIKQIFDFAIEGFGVRKIKRLLTEQGIFNRDGKQFSEHHLLYMLKNPRYMGLNVRNRWGKVDLYNANKQREKDESEWIVQKTDKIDKIIEKEQFDKVQKLISKRSTTAKGVHLGQGELAQKIVCGVCGSFYTRNREVYKTGNVRVYYNCSNKKKNGVKACSGRNVNILEIDKEIDLFRKVAYKRVLTMTQKALIQKLDKRKVEILSNKNKDNTVEMASIKSKIKEHESKLRELLENMLESSSATLKKVYNSKIELIENQLKILESKLQEFQADDDKINEVLNNIDTMIKTINAFEAKENMTREEFLDELICIVVKENNLKMLTKNYKYMSDILDIINNNVKDKSSKKQEIEKLREFSNKLRLS